MKNFIFQSSISFLVLFVLGTSFNAEFSNNLSADLETSPQAEELIYGKTYKLQNLWSAHSTYLFAYGDKGCQGNQYCLASIKERSVAGAGAEWTIVSAEGKKDGTAVKKGDKIMLKNMYDNGNGGYLGTRGYGKDFGCAGDLCVSTYKEKDAYGSSTWEITGDVQLGSGIQLAGQWNRASAGYLHISGHHPNNGYNVATSKNIADGNKTWIFRAK